MQVSASLNHLHMAPRKIRLISDLIRGMTVVRAEIELKHLPKRGADFLLKLLRSASANAKNNFQLNTSDLYIKEIRVDGGPVLKRFRPRAFGRAATIRKRTSHVSLILESAGDAQARPKRADGKNSPVISDSAEGLQTMAKKDNVGKTQTRKETKAAGMTSAKKSKGFAQKVFRRKAI